jgi:hypothetical protein
MIDILQYVREQLAARRGSWPVIARYSSVPLRTLEKIARGSTPNPGVKTVQALAEYLRAHE